MDLTLALAQGFHNAPRLYGDTTVRTAPHVTGFRSGLRAAGSEFALSIYDGVTGLVSQPYRGAQQNGPVGFLHGVGKGFGGFVLKDLAAIFAPFGFTMKGVHKEIVKGRQPTKYLRKAQVLRGTIDFVDLEENQREDAVAKTEAAWRIISNIHREDDAQKSEGVKGKVAVLREQRQMNQQGAFQNIETAKETLMSKQAQRKRRESRAQASTIADCTQQTDRAWMLPTQ